MLGFPTAAAIYVVPICQEYACGTGEKQELFAIVVSGWLLSTYGFAQGTSVSP